MRFRDRTARAITAGTRPRTADASGTVVGRVDYDVPGGRYVHDWLVAPELMRIFTFRQRKLQEIFGVNQSNGVKVAIQIKL